MHLWYTKAIKNRKAVDGMKRFITGFVCGALLFGVVGALAVEYNVTPNPFKVMVDGQEVQIEGYNINDRSYFQLRDIGDVIGFSVGFVDGTVMIDSSGKPIEETQTQPEQPSNDVATPEEIQAYFDTFDEATFFPDEFPPYNKTKDGYMYDMYHSHYPTTVGKTFDGLKIHQWKENGDLTVDDSDISNLWLRTYKVSKDSFYAIKTPEFYIVDNEEYYGRVPLDYYYNTLIPAYVKLLNE